MKKKTVNKIFYEEAKRKRRIIIYSVIIALIAFSIAACFYLYINQNKVRYVNYRENSKVDYNVYLKQNEFFNESYLPANRQYIASIVDYINASFDYKLEMLEADVDYSYSYKIEATVTVKEKSTRKILYTYTDLLDQKTKVDSSNKSSVSLNKMIKIDYNKYNRLISKFVNVYSLNGSISTLDVKMNVNVKGDSEEISNTNTSTAISLSIPLTTDTVDIAMKSNVLDNNLIKQIPIHNDDNKANIILICIVSLCAIEVLVIIILILYIKRTMSPKSIYDKELKKIVFNYKSFIQKVNSTIDLKKYQIYDVDNFTDLLEIRDTINQPILMGEYEKGEGTYFLVPTDTKIAYVYSLRVSDIRKNLLEEQKKK